jgi:DNA-binding transcriptional ArsR family regulator
MALADATRRELIFMLRQGEKTVSQLAELFTISMAAISKHVKVLENAGIVKRRIKGRIHFLTLIPEQLTCGLDWIMVYRNSQ